LNVRKWASTKLAAGSSSPSVNSLRLQKSRLWVAFFIFGLPEYHAPSFKRSGAIKNGF
jgi:hypothetical protein